MMVQIRVVLSLHSETFSTPRGVYMQPHVQPIAGTGLLEKLSLFLVHRIFTAIDCCYPLQVIT